jgi:hypothetical protein
MRTFARWLEERGGMDQLIDLLVPDHRQVRRMAHDYARRHYAPRIRARAEGLGVQIESHEVEQILTRILGPEVELPEFDIDFYNRHC